MHNTNVIIRPLVTEKSTHQQATRNAYAFEVAPKATKLEVPAKIDAAQFRLPKGYTVSQGPPPGMPMIGRPGPPAKR